MEKQMLRADSAHVNWDTGKKQWLVRVKIGEEIIRRPLPKTPQTAPDNELRALAVESARADGYDMDPAKVEIAH